MTQVLRGQQRQDRGESSGTGGLAKRDPDRGAIARAPDYRRQIDRVFDRLMREFDRDPLTALAQLPARLANLADWPPIDIAEDDRSLTVRVDVPGLSLDDLNVEMSGNVLTIRGQREDEWSDNERGVVRRERVSGTFARAIQLPSYVDPSRIQASYDNGTLTITIPKIEGQGPRHVEVTSGSGQTSGDGGRARGQQGGRQTTTGQTAAGQSSTAGGQNPAGGPSAAAAQTMAGQGGGAGQQSSRT